MSDRLTERTHDEWIEQFEALGKQHAKQIADIVGEAVRTASERPCAGCAALRETLAGVVGASAPDELERMARFIREDGSISDEDRTVTLKAIVALAQSQPDGTRK